MSYDPTLGRWLEADPEGYIDGNNRYLAERASSVSIVDPFGLKGVPEIGPFDAPALIDPGYQDIQLDSVSKDGVNNFIDKYILHDAWSETFLAFANDTNRRLNDVAANDRITNDGKLNAILVVRFHRLAVKSDDPVLKCYVAEFNRLAWEHEQHVLRIFREVWNRPFDFDPTGNPELDAKEKDRLFKERFEEQKSRYWEEAHLPEMYGMYALLQSIVEQHVMEHRIRRLQKRIVEGQMMDQWEYFLRKVEKAKADLLSVSRHTPKCI
jgi:hypothetical protein